MNSKDLAIKTLKPILITILIVIGGLWIWSHRDTLKVNWDTVLVMLGIKELKANCSPSGTSGYLYLADVVQEEGSWCWVASAKVLTDFFDLKWQVPSTDPPHLMLYPQCRLYDIGKGAPTGCPFECCASNAPGSDARCLENGWPKYVFDNLPSPITYDYTNEPLKWPDVQNQICPISGESASRVPGRPFIFYKQWFARDVNGNWIQDENGNPILFAHTSVVEGYNEDPVTGRKTVFIDDHEIGGSQVSSKAEIDYVCRYRLDDLDCAPPLTGHGGDYYNISPPAGTAPPAPE